MLKKSNVAAAIAAAALAAAALASPASAQPIDLVTLDSPGHEFQFGESGSCSAGAAPGAPAEVDWNESANGNSVRPEIDGDLCLQNTNAEARVAVVYHDIYGQTVTKFSSSPGTGNGGPLSAFLVADIGSRVSKTSTHHVHLRVEKRNASGGWDTVSGADRVLYVP
jgi:hypothetical protein